VNLHSKKLYTQLTIYQIIYNVNDEIDYTLLNINVKYFYLVLVNKDFLHISDYRFSNDFEVLYFQFFEYFKSFIEKQIKNRDFHFVSQILVFKFFSSDI